MAGWKNIQRGNFDDQRIRRNWQKLAIAFENLLNGDQFGLGPNGELTLTGGLSERYNVYDATGNLVLTGSAQTVPYDTEQANSATGIFTDLTNGELTITLTNSEAFTFGATVTVQHDDSSDPEFQCRVWLEQDTGSGFAEVPGSSVTIGSVT